MDTSQLNWIANFIWNIADDHLRDVYVRGKYRDVILPMTVIRRLDAVLEPTKQAVLDMKKLLDSAGVTDQRQALCKAAGQAFYNASPFLLRDLKSVAQNQQLRQDFEAYLNGFSPNVREIIDKFKFRNQIPTMIEANILGSVIEKFLDPSINLSPFPVKDADGREVLPALDNHAMGTVFEALILKFNEENNEEAGEHYTPREVVRLMAQLLFVPVADRIESGTYLLYDGACGTGGMLTVAQEILLDLAAKYGKEVSIHLFGQEINPETYAICKADLLLKGEGQEAENIVGGADKSTLSNDAFPSREFDFMLSNPPYGKSWKTDLERMGGKTDLKDPRFVISHGGDPEYKLVTRSSDGQLMFLVNKLAKMKRNTRLGSRIALVHNGSALFTGDAGQGESNIRRWILENDWLEAIIALPLNMFYNTGIATYVWVLTNRKAEARKGKVQLIDATQWFKPLRKNLGKKNCELGEEDLARIVRTLVEFTETENSKIFQNEAFGYWKMTVERPLRLRSQFTRANVEALRFATGDAALRRELFNRFGNALYDDFRQIRGELEQVLLGEDEAGEEDGEENAASRKKAVPEKRRKKLLDAETWRRDHRLLLAAKAIGQVIGDEAFMDHNVFRERFDAVAKEVASDLSAVERKLVQRAVSERDEAAAPVLAGKPGKPKKEVNYARERLYGQFLIENDKPEVVEYEPDSELRDTEQVPLLEVGGIEGFFKREVLPYAEDAWIDPDSIKVGYEISFARYFYKPQPLRTLEEIKKEISELENQTDGLLKRILGASV
ncbi:MAG TPA: class I SAM-dependent DNA methyltransferase [Candidatus Competibacter sp.]|nr:SAM-dependent DNA methyltransferase [Candidatus Competibacteraceae bacterium]HPE71179.1 class I SAM-dependent DNA methyltransferase [Candidatus Competibacter sp.]HRW64733.1 class I SAM-dependent DNA methyltransferase [Candidatus Competibacter sp.]